jgi:hypothetical protein
MPPLRVNMCGWLGKMSTGVLTNGTWKKKWFILCGDKFWNYESPLHMSHVKSMISCLNVTALAESADGTLVVKYIEQESSRGRQWDLRWTEPESTKNSKLCWKRRITAASPSLLKTAISKLKAK